ncbi:M20/M25/M40 family metallo-hydrolase [Nocardia yamanashiensis]|uniref:M20/M25/M40 family metallo-hydrolase n=1 Tax=Nocardia yamanashiensis TaxID=209247 RepID=UPI00082F4E39|nr:M20/M25/M40 family metallo-hydrolase [Nocardia yamanashiensis]
MRVGRGISGLLAFALLLVVAVATAWNMEPHGYRDAAAPAEEFSAARAHTVIEAIARKAHPVGTAEHDRVRDHLAGELRKLGLSTEIRAGVGLWPRAFGEGVHGGGRIENIVGTVRGTAPTGTVYLVAHYDSVPSAPGANDDGAGVAAILEAVRALRSGETALRNDLVVLLTDGEEPGLFGAEAFAAAGGYDRNGVIINHEARGAGGPPLLWRLAKPDGALVRAVSNTTPHPNTDSLTTALAGTQTSSNTDFAAFEPHGLRVLDWAFAGKSAYYHNRLDDPEHVNLATLQQLGDNTLAQVKEFGERDLAADAADDSDAAYFALPFGLLVVVPLWVMIACAVLGVLAAAWVVWQVKRSGETGVWRVIGAAVTAVLAVPVAVGLTWGWWLLVQQIRPAYAAMPVDPYRPGCFQAAVLILAAAALLGWYALARRIFGATAAGVGMLCAAVSIGILAAALAPAASEIVVVPAAAAAVGVAVTFLTPERWRLAVLTAFLLPAAVFVGGNAWTTTQAGLTAAPFLAAPLIVLLGGLLLLTLTHAWPQRRGWTIPVTALVVVLALTGAGLAVDRTDDNHPRTSQLVYVLDADRKEARWLSTLAPDPYTREFVSDAQPEGPYAELWKKAVASGPAPAQALSAPVAEIISDKTDSGLRTVKLRLRSTRGATRIDLFWSTVPQRLRVADRRIETPPAQSFRFFAPGKDGVEMELVVPAGPLSLRLADYTWLPDSNLNAYRNPPQDTFFRQDSVAQVFVSVPGL